MEKAQSIDPGAGTALIMLSIIPLWALLMLAAYSVDPVGVCFDIGGSSDTCLKGFTRGKVVYFWSDHRKPGESPFGER